MPTRTDQSNDRDETAESEQQAVVAFLTDPGSYPGALSKVERIDTHAAIVFLAGRRAYKVKRAVKLPYLDYSTLALRQLMCGREFEINARTAPSLYRGVVAITREADGGLVFNGQGEVIEWAIEMERFDQDCLLNRMAESGELTLRHMEQLADHIAEFHAAAEAYPAVDGAQAMSKVIGYTVPAFEAATGQLPADQADRYREMIHAVLDAQSPLLRRRAERGYVRRCHGDMHLRNIVLIEGEPTLFDAIEFDDELTTIDVLYDLAFLVMDLWHRDLKAHANHVTNVYLGHASDLQDLVGLAAMPLFLSCRAAVRAMVGLDQLPHVSEDERPDIARESLGYFDLANRLLKPDPPRLVAIGGLSGTGKSTLGAALAPQFGAAPGALHLRSDVERKRLFGLEPTERLGPDAYRPAVNARVFHELNRRAKAALEAGHSVLVDAVFLRADERVALQAVADELAVPFSGLWLSAPKKILIERVTKRSGDASDADAQVVELQLGRSSGPISWVPIDAGGPPDEVAAQAATQLGI